MGAIASQITSLTIVFSTIYSDADQIKHQSSASLAFVWGIHRGPAGEFPTQMTSNAENVSIWWRHHDVADNVDKGVHSTIMCQVAVPGSHMRIDTYTHQHTHTYMRDVIFAKRDI